MKPEGESHFKFWEFRKKRAARAEQELDDFIELAEDINSPRYNAINDATNAMILDQNGHKEGFEFYKVKMLARIDDTIYIDELLEFHRLVKNYRKTRRMPLSSFIEELGRKRNKDIDRRQQS